MLNDLDTKFFGFLEGYEEDGKYKYRERISRMANEGRISFHVEYDDLLAFDPELALKVVEEPDTALKSLNRAALTLLRRVNPEYAKSVKRIFARVRKLPEKVPLNQIGGRHIGRLIEVEGIVVSITPRMPVIRRAMWRCRKCGTLTPVDQDYTMALKRPSECSNIGCTSRRFDLEEKLSEWTDIQFIKIQERPEELPPGSVPTVLKVRLLDDLVGKVRPGDVATITCIVRPQSKRAEEARLRMFDIILEAVSVDVVSKEAEALEITPEDEQKIVELSKDPDIVNKIVASIAPSLHGEIYEHVKKAIALMLFGGEPIELPDGTRKRGDIHILLVGDPATGKSMLLQHVVKIAPRALYVVGERSTGAGLTAAVVREKTGWVLEAGAMVLADKGICCVDELDKMASRERDMLNEALEQQTVTIHKANIHATLQARTSVLAAVNPVSGKYNRNIPFLKNVSHIPTTILSRFDLFFVLLDEPARTQEDESIASHMLKIYSEAERARPAIDPLLLKKYIAYARTRIKPKLTEEASREILRVYMQLRSRAAKRGEILVTRRTLDALVRLSTARARMELREEVTKKDVEEAVSLFKRSLEVIGHEYDIATGITHRARKAFHEILDTIQEIQEEKGTASVDDIIRRTGLNRYEVEETIERLKDAGLIYEKAPGEYRTTTRAA